MFLLNFKEYDLKLFFNILFLKKSILQKECYTTQNRTLSSFPAFEAAHNYRGGGYTDWWLPSSRELSLMYAMVGIIDQVSEANGGDPMLNDRNNPPYSFYWSSRESEDNSTNAWYLDFFFGYQYTNVKDDPCAVRCVRAF